MTYQQALGLALLYLGVWVLPAVILAWRDRWREVAVDESLPLAGDAAVAELPSRLADLQGCRLRQTAAYDYQLVRRTSPAWTLVLPVVFGLIGGMVMACIKEDRIASVEVRSDQDGRPVAILSGHLSKSAIRKLRARLVAPAPTAARA